VFGFSPPAGLPDTSIHTFANRLHNRDAPERYRSPEAYDNYLAHNPHNEFRSIYPVKEGRSQDEEKGEFVVDGAEEIVVRGRALRLPSSDEYKQHEIELEEPPRVRVFELCRFLANVGREWVLATAQERPISVLPDMTQIVQLEDWHDPNVVDNADRPRGSETFQQLAQVLTTGEVAIYHPSQPPNTHWRNWPDGGNL
jgi:hypothetical protein